MEVRNPGLAFNKAVFKNLNPTNKNAYRTATNALHTALFKLNLDTFNAELLNVKTTVDGDSRKLVQPTLNVAWPGLLIGLGYGHSAKTGADNKNHPLDTEMKSGFYFDFTTGLPVLPGSTVKGILRSYFPRRYNHNKELKEAVNNRLSDILKTQFPGKDYHNNIEKLEDTIFEGKNMPSTRQDIFFDAYPCEGVNTKAFIKNPPEAVNEAFLGEDVLTPHRHPLQDPVPLKLLKILPGVKFKFQFLLNGEGGMTTADKEKLFIYLLQEFGAGARKGVGFGQFLMDEVEVPQNNNWYIPFAPLTKKRWDDSEIENDEDDEELILERGPAKPAPPVQQIIEDETWVEPATIKKGDKIKGTIQKASSGNLKVLLHIKGKKIIASIDGKGIENQVMDLSVITIEGKPDKDTFNVKVKRVN